MNISFPAFYCPFPSALNVNVAQVHQHSIDWVQRWGLVNGEHALRRFQSAKYAWLASRAYPAAPFTELSIIAEWNIWLFFHDDQCDEAGIGRQPAKLARLYDRLRDILRHSPPTSHDLPFVKALHDLVLRMQACSTVEWQERFRQSVDEYFASCIWEAENRVAQRVPDMPTYIRMRPFTGALNTDIDLIEVAEHIALPVETRAHPVIQRLTLLCNNAVCWSNDIISLEKELRSGDLHNLVVVVQHEQQCSWQEAVDRVAEMHDAQVQEFIQLQEQLPSFSPDVDEALQRYVAVLRAWMRGNLDWALDTGRYSRAAVSVS